MALAAAARSLFIHFRETSPVPPMVRFAIPPPDKGAFAQWLALSPDGRYLAFTASGADAMVRIWIRSLDSLDLRPLPGTEASTVVTFFWSPDSRSVIFQGGSKIRKVDVAGGSPLSLCDSPVTMLNGSGNSTGTLLFGSNNGPIYRVSSAGWGSHTLTRIERSRNENYPRRSPLSARWRPLPLLPPCGGAGLPGRFHWLH